MKKCNLIFLFLFIFASTSYSQDRIELKGEEKYNVINNIIKANNFFGYKGEVSVEVLFHKEGAVNIEGMSANEDRKYRAYFDLQNSDMQKLFFIKIKTSPSLR